MIAWLLATALGAPDVLLEGPLLAAPESYQAEQPSVFGVGIGTVFPLLRSEGDALVVDLSGLARGERWGNDAWSRMAVVWQASALVGPLWMAHPWGERAAGPTPYGFVVIGPRTELLQFPLVVPIVAAGAELAAGWGVATDGLLIELRGELGLSARQVTVAANLPGGSKEWAWTAHHLGLSLRVGLGRR